jgi:hypothetical protein
MGFVIYTIKFRPWLFCGYKAVSVDTGVFPRYLRRLARQGRVSSESGFFIAEISKN